MEKADRCGETQIRLGCRQPLTDLAVCESRLEMFNDGSEIRSDAVLVKLEGQIDLGQ